MDATTVKVLAIAAGAAVVGFVLYKGMQKGAQAAQAVGQAINPVSDQNLAYRGANAVGEAVTGDKHFTVGGKVWDWFNGDTNKQIEDMLRGSAPVASYDESERLARRYPAPPPAPATFADVGAYDFGGSFGWGMP